MRPFLTVWSGQAISLLGSQLVQFAIVWWLTRTTGSATVLALATLAALLPQIAIGPFAGALVDRWSRRAVMIVADIAIALATLVLAALFLLNAAPLWTVYALLLVRSTGAAFHWPAMQASTTLMVPAQHLARVGGLNQALGGLAGILIPPLGALAVEALPMQGVLAIDVLTAVPAIVSLLLIAIPQPASAPGPATTSRSLWGDMREGLRFVLGWKAFIMMSVIGVLIHMLGRAASALTPLLVMQHFQGSALELGWWLSAAGVGSLLGGLVLGVWGGFKRRVVTQMLALALDGIGIVAIGLSPQQALWPAMALTFLTGFLEAIVLGLSGAIGQAIIPPEVQGRVFALSISVSQALAPLGLLVAGPVADRMGVPFWFVLTGVMIVAMGGGAFLFPAVIHIEDEARAHWTP